MEYTIFIFTESVEHTFKALLIITQDFSGNHE